MFQPNQLYRHYKGALYRIITLATLVAEQGDSTERMVVYHDLAHPEKIWVRALSVFSETIERNGIRVPRFERVEDESA